MAQTAVDVVVRVKGESGLTRLQKGLKGVDSSLDKTESKIRRFEGSVAKLGRTLAGLAIGDQLRRAFGAAAELSGTEQRITNVTKKYAQFAGIQNSAAQAAKTFAISQQQALSDFSDLASRLGATGASLKDLENIYGGFNTLLLENAVGAQQAAAAQLQLNQALGSGRLAGEEFNSINETTPQLLDEVANVLGVARGELKQLASDGLISSQVLIQALTNIKTNGVDALAASLDTPAGKLRQFDAAIKNFQVTVGEELLPVITPLIVEMTKLLKAFGELPGPVKTAAVGLTALLAAATVLGPLFGAIAGGAKALGAALLSLGAGGSAAAGALSLTTKALLVLKGAMIALPWVGLAAGIAVLAKVTVDYYTKKQELQRIIKGTGVTMNEFETAIANTSNQLAAAKGKLNDMEQAGYKNARAINAQKNRVQELQAQLNAIEGTYTARLQVLIDIQEQSQNIAGIDYKPDGPGGRLVPINPPKTVSQIKEEQAAKLASQLSSSLGSSGGGGGGGGGGGVTRESRVPDLQRELDLAAKLEPLYKRIADARLLGDEETVIRLQGQEQLLRLQKEELDIVSSKLPADEKRLEIEKIGFAVRKQVLQTTSELNELEQRRKNALEGVKAPIEDEIELLQAKLNGNEEEIKQLQEIKKLKQSILAIDPNADTSGIEAAVKQRDQLKAQVAEMEDMKSMMSSLASGIASEFTNAFKSVIDGTKSVEEAFADMLQGIANKFLDMAMQILQDALTKQLMSLFGSLLSSPVGGNTMGGFYAAGARLLV